MSKRAIFICMGIILFVVCFYIGFNFNKEEDAEKNIVAVNSVEIKEKKENSIVKNETIAVSSNEEKTTPNTILVFKRYYSDCEHTISNISNIEEYQVNLTKEEMKDEYPNWEIEKFSSKEVVFYKESDSFCGEHYLLTEEDGYISIYTLDEEGNKELKEKGKIAVEYLPETDKISLKNGITVYGTEELNKLLEDFES